MQWFWASRSRHSLYEDVRVSTKVTNKYLGLQNFPDNDLQTMNMPDKREDSAFQYISEAKEICLLNILQISLECSIKILDIRSI